MEAVRLRVIFAAGAASALVACNAPAPPGNTGGTDRAPGECGRGVVVVSTDYTSSNVSLLDWDGAVLSGSFLSSASAPSSGVSAALSGDVVLPTMPRLGDRLLLIDRFPASVLTWADVRGGEVTGQLSIATGFGANPQDYVEVSPRKAYVTRYEPNLDAGKEPFDGGSDVLVVDPEAPAVVGRIDLGPAMAGEDAQFYPRPNEAVLAGDKLYVLLAGYSLYYRDSAESRVVEIDTDDDTITSVAVLRGLHGCAGLGISASGARIAVACSGTFRDDSSSDLVQAGLVVLVRGERGLVEEKRWAPDEIGAGPPGFFVTFAAEDTVVLTTFGREASAPGGALDDLVVAFDLERGGHEVLLRSQKTPFSLGEARCAPACGRCLVADAETDGGVVHRFDLEAGVFKHAGAVAPEPRIALPPRYLGAF
jgi:hypothetical protein